MERFASGVWICSALCSRPRVRMRIVPFSVLDPAKRVTFPVATESEGTVAPMAANACCSTITACGSRCGGCCEKAELEYRRVRRSRVGREKRMAHPPQQEVAESLDYSRGTVKRKDLRKSMYWDQTVECLLAGPTAQ